MPCYESRTISVEFHAEHRAVLDDAIASLGWRVREMDNGVLSVNGGWLTIYLEEGRAVTSSQSDLNRLKVAYSKESLKRACKRNGWQLKLKGQKGVLRR